MIKRLPLLCWLLCAALLGACSPEVEEIPATTQATLRISAEASLASRIDKLRFALWTKGPARWEPGTSTEVVVRPSDWPLTVPVLPKVGTNSNASFEVIIEAFANKEPLLQTRVVAKFVANNVVSIPSSLALCATPGLTCQGDECHGPECTLCAASGKCEPAGVTPPDSQIDLSVADGGKAPVDGGLVSGTGDAGGAAGSHNTPDGGGTTAVAPNDGGGASPAPDASVSMSAPDTGTPPVTPLPTACDAPNVCNALLYPCLPTPAGYTCQGQFADWHMPDGVADAKFAQSYTSTGETAIDNVTKLEWQVGLPNAYPGCTGRQLLPSGVLGPYAEWCSREEAKNYCNQLERGGHDDWRLPSLIELTSLLDMRSNAATATAVDVGFFGDSTSQDFIASSTGASGPSLTWMVSYELREVVLLRNLNGRVRCVRGGAVPDFAKPADRYLIASDTVTDRATSLVWQRAFSATPLAQDAALTYCAGLGPGYRLPTGNELMTLVDPTREKPAIDPVAFPGTPSSYFATSNKLVVESTVSFESGMLQHGLASDAYVRCVRN